MKTIKLFFKAADVNLHSHQQNLSPHVFFLKQAYAVINFLALTVKAFFFFFLQECLLFFRVEEIKKTINGYHLNSHKREDIFHFASKSMFNFSSLTILVDQEFLRSISNMAIATYYTSLFQRKKH